MSANDGSGCFAENKRHKKSAYLTQANDRHQATTPAPLFYAPMNKPAK